MIKHNNDVCIELGLTPFDFRFLPVAFSLCSFTYKQYKKLMKNLTLFVNKLIILSPLDTSKDPRSYRVPSTITNIPVACL